MSPLTSRPVRTKLWIGISLLGIAGAAAYGYYEYHSTRQAKQLAENNLRVVLFAVRGYCKYEQACRMLPQAICDKQGKPLLSWRVALLPYIEQKSVYDRFKLDEPWDSPHNIKLLKYMPSVYQSLRRNAANGETYLQLVTGPGTVFPDPPASKRPGFNDCFRRLLIVEAAKSVPWTKPDDVDYSEKMSATALGGDFGVGQFLGAYGDGLVQWHAKVSDEELRARILGTSNGIDDTQGMPAAPPDR